MGEIAEMMLEGNMCQWCGEILNGDGYPTICGGCQIEHGVDAFGKPLDNTPDKNPVSSGSKPKRTMTCSEKGCHRRFATHNAYLQHWRAKHG